MKDFVHSRCSFKSFKESSFFRNICNSLLVKKGENMDYLFFYQQLNQSADFLFSVEDVELNFF